ncbi:MAG: 3-dehydroquinate synthase [Methylotetracoccus sp.]|nr:3-dehydroquinate synthase [Methylotetracoccus sp.]
MRTLTVDLGARSYPIYIGGDLLSDRGLWARHLAAKQVMVVTNDTVAPLYLDSVLANLSDKQVETVILPDGEQYKTLDSAAWIWDRLIHARFSRNACLIALGGGVIGDLGGFAAACYQRGIPFVQAPTTLLAQVDSSVGGKTGVNHALGKNMIGAFYQPLAVIADTSSLTTLPDRELSAGLAEVIKYGLIRDAAFFGWIEANIDALLRRDPTAVGWAIERSCRNKAEVVTADEHESGVRATLNLGHTFGHAIETGAGYGVYLHGEAVAIGTCIAADLSVRLGRLDPVSAARIRELLQRARLPIRLNWELSPLRMLELMAVDKKNVDGRLRLILLQAIGEATLPLEIDGETVRATLEHCLAAA